jgi:hypothetical protein
MNRTAVATLLLSSLIAACGASDPSAPSDPVSPAAPAAAPAPASSEADVTELCRQSFVRQRECQDTYLPALVDLRVRLDVPAGIAARDRAEGREALLAVAEEEYAVDSTDQAIAATCDKIVAEVPEANELAPRMSECLAHDSCDPFVDCILVITEEHLAPR